MKPLLSPEELAALGIEPGSIGPGSVILPPGLEHGEGSVSRERLTLAAILSGLATAPYHEVRSPAAESAGARIEVHVHDPLLWKIVLPPGARPEIRALAEDDGVQAAAADPDDPATIHADLRAARATVLCVEKHLSLLIAPGEGGPAVFLVQAPVDQPAPFATIRAPIRDWAAASSDSWLARELKRLATAEDDWAAVVAAGMFARLYQAPDPEMPRSAVQALLAGSHPEPNPAGLAPRLWASKLSPDEVQTIEDYALAEVDRLWFILDELLDAPDYDPPDAGEYRELCHRRDDLEGVRVILAQVGRGDRLALALLGLDDAAMELAPPPDAGDDPDERLRRVFLADPGAWWADTAGDDAIPSYFGDD